MDSNSGESLHSAVATEDKNIAKYFYWNHTYDLRASIEQVPVPRLRSARIQPVSLQMMMFTVGQIHRQNSHQNRSGHCPLAVRRV
jgi:hypothetical protein